MNSRPLDSDRTSRWRVLIVLGVSGVGKTTVGRLLAERLKVDFFDADDFHSDANHQKMRAGQPLTDRDREPWLEALGALIEAILARQGRAVIACSALRAAYRERFHREAVRFIYLKAPPGVVAQRLAHRRGHFLDPRLLDSQFLTLEEPRGALTIDAEQPVDAIVSAVVGELQDSADSHPNSPACESDRKDCL